VEVLAVMAQQEAVMATPAAAAQREAVETLTVTA
jgi:hypothetical protein